MVLEAPFRLMAGVLILIPGLISDALAFLILIPFVRKALWIYGFSRLFRGQVFHQTWTTGSSTFQSAQDDVVDVNFVREERDVTPVPKEVISQHSESQP